MLPCVVTRVQGVYKTKQHHSSTAVLYCVLLHALVIVKSLSDEQKEQISTGEADYMSLPGTNKQGEVDSTLDLVNVTNSARLTCSKITGSLQI